MIKDLPFIDKPREKANIMGINNLTDAELIAILLRTGTKKASVLELAHQVVNTIGSVSDLSNATLETLCQIKGIGKTKAITLLSALELGKRSLKRPSYNFKVSNSKEVYENLKYYFFNQNQELFFVLFLDRRKNVIKIKQIYQGTKNRININFKEVFKEAILHNCDEIIIVHNHPSGLAYPSKYDYDSTQKIIKAGSVLNINLVDHIIITNDTYYSFFESGDLK